MNIKTYQPIFTLTVFSILAFLINKAIFQFVLPGQPDADFVHSLLRLYGFFFLLSAVILFILIQISKVSMTNVGMTFILLTTFKMGIAYVFLKPVLEGNTIHSGLEKTNFLVVFLLFLTMETLITIRLINNKQE